MPIVDPSSLPRVALAFQNDDHEEEARLLNVLGEVVQRGRLGNATRDEVLITLRELTGNTRQHFAHENGVMQETGFFALAMHKSEHDRVLAQLDDEEQAYRQGGDIDRLWRYVSETLPAWFVNHIRTMDAVTGQFAVSKGLA